VTTAMDECDELNELDIDDEDAEDEGDDWSSCWAGGMDNDDG
jgi:hypothetical protein